MQDITRNYLSYWADAYKEQLINDIFPFWLKHGADRQNGGYYTCLDRQGNLYDSTKSVWFQGRFAFNLAYAYNQIAPQEEWLYWAKSGIDFIEQHCTDTDGRMYFEVTAEGIPLRKRRYLFSESFAAIAMAEYAIAAKDKNYAEKALNLFRLILHYKNTPGLLASKYLPGMQSKGHSLCMILINTASRIRQALPSPELDAQIDASLNEIKRDFLHPEYKALLETVGPNGEFIDTAAGRLINPGHCIETAWFILEEAKHRQWDKELTQLGLTIFDWAWEWGWDETFHGGIINFRDCKNQPVQDYSQDMKFWWPQTETIIASLYAYLATGDEKYIKRHQLISDYTYSHFPDRQYGEWYGYLHRDGRVAQPAKGNIFKGPFHIPRMLIKSHKLCQEILSL